jgi:hypothetical protein
MVLTHHIMKASWDFFSFKSIRSLRNSKCGVSEIFTDDAYLET